MSITSTVAAGRGATIRVVPDGSTAISILIQKSGLSGWVLRGPLMRSAQRRFGGDELVEGRDIPQTHPATRHRLRGNPRRG
jgi:hypothetical protein